MATLNSFVGTWTVTGWAPEDHNYGFLFPLPPLGGSCTLQIVGDQNLELTWTDGAFEHHQINFNNVNSSATQISSVPVLIAGFSCIVSLALGTSPPLSGGITLEDRRIGEGPVGTFTAEANDGNEGKEVVGAPRLEESLAV